LTRNGRRARVFPVLPWIFIIGVAVGTIAGNHYWRSWIRWPAPINASAEKSDSEMLWRHAGNPNVRHPVTVLRTIDGDTFEARVALWPDLTITTRVRLRGIDAPELKARCADEFRRAEAAAGALDALLNEGNVTIFNIGPDKYPGRVDANVATSRTPNVSAALLAGGYARPYDGGHRDGWCSGR
jgi:endonuclease YncB( thermonuclease family)